MGENMKKIIHRAGSRGHFDHGWLKTWHTFSFAEYRNPDRTSFGALRVLNDDTIAPNTGFGTHPHRNMEIVTIPLEGTLAHRDSLGHEQTIRRNEVQVMTAGRGITHSEFNARDDEPVTLLQIWILPREANLTPRYAQKEFSPVERLNQFQLLVGPKSDQESLWIHQDAYFSLANISAGKTLSYPLRDSRHGVYLFVIKGTIDVADETLTDRDGLAVVGTADLRLTAKSEAEALVIEVPL